MELQSHTKIKVIHRSVYFELRPKLCRIDGKAPNAMSVALQLLSGIDHPVGNYQDADALDALHTHCFAPGVQALLASGESKNVEDVEASDVVLAWNAATGAVDGKRVLRVFRNVSDHYRVLQWHGAHGLPQEIRTTDGHPLWVEGKGWVDAGELVPGDKLLQEDGRLATVVSTVYEAHPEGVPIYNFEVEGDHTYFVSQRAGDQAVLVHNKSPKLKGKKAPPCKGDPCERLGIKRGFAKWKHAPLSVKDENGNRFSYLRVKSVIAYLPLLGMGSKPSSAAQAFVQYIGKQGHNDDAGHVIGRQFGGPGGKTSGNIFPQNWYHNEVTQQLLETSLSRNLLRKRLCVSITLSYDRPRAARPYRVTYNAWVNKRHVVWNKKIPNPTVPPGLPRP